VLITTVCTPNQVRPRRAVPCCCTPRSPVAVSCSSMNNQQGGEDASGQQQPGEEKAQEHAVINTYHLVDVPEPQAVSASIVLSC